MVYSTIRGHHGPWQTISEESNNLLCFPTQERVYWFRETNLSWFDGWAFSSEITNTTYMQSQFSTLTIIKVKCIGFFSRTKWAAKCVTATKSLWTEKLCEKILRLNDGLSSFLVSLNQLKLPADCGNNPSSQMAKNLSNNISWSSVHKVTEFNKV